MITTIKPAYLFLGAALLLSACSEDDQPGNIGRDDNRVIFHTSLPGITSRAEVVTTESLDYFMVTAFDPEDEAKVKAGVLDTLFGYQKINVVKDVEYQSSPLCLWPDPGKESHGLTFFSFYPDLDRMGNAEILNASTTEAFDYSIKGITLRPDIADQFDFIAAYTTGSMENNLFSGITLPFRHQLSRIEVKAYSGHKSCDIEIAGVRIGGVDMKANFNFKADGSAGSWSDLSDRGVVEYIFGKDDKIVSLKNGNAATATDAGAVSIMGNAKPDGNNAMLIPAVYATPWDYATDRTNKDKNPYISVLLRITYATLTSGIRPEEPQRYPYRDLSQGADALDVPKVYLVVDKTAGTVSSRVYLKDSEYYKDPECTVPYALLASEEVKEFGWAAVPVTGSWEAGNIYTYTLNYSEGIGVHDPSLTTASPQAGDPVISDKVAVVSYSVKTWQPGGGDEFVVPGS